MMLFFFFLNLPLSNFRVGLLILSYHVHVCTDHALGDLKKSNYTQLLLVFIYSDRRVQTFKLILATVSYCVLDF